MTKRFLIGLLALSASCIGVTAAEDAAKPATTPATPAPELKPGAAAPKKVSADDEAEVTLTPIVTYVDVSGNAAKFRELNWMKDGWTGGVEQFKLHENFGKDGIFNLEGHATFDQNDYKVKMEWLKPDFGFVRAGFSQYPKYFSDYGGYYPRFNTPAIGLNEDPRIDIGNIFADVGLTLPNMPKLTIGYERQYKNGEKSMVEWGGVTQNGLAPGNPSWPNGNTTKNIYPALKGIDETVDIFKFDVEHDIGSLHLENQFRFEQYKNDTYRQDDTSVNLTTNQSKPIMVNEKYNHDMFSNAYEMEQNVNEKIFWSTGYLYSHLNGGGSFADTTSYTGGIAPGATDKFWVSNDIDLAQESHVVDANIMFGPFKGLTMYTGLQAEKTSNDGAGNVILGTFANRNSPVADIKTESTRDSLEERFGARYTTIPYTTLYAEGKLGQQDIQLYEHEWNAGSSGFERLTGDDVWREEARAGFNTSPWSRLTWSGEYKHSWNDNEYAHKMDKDNTGASAAGTYSGFITGQQFDTDQFTTKLNYRVSSKVQMALKYQRQTTDVYTQTNPVPTTGGTHVHASTYNLNIYSASVTVTPINRLYVTGMVSWQDTSTQSADWGDPAIGRYRGNVYSVIGSAGYALDEKTDLIADYSFSTANDFKNNGWSTTAANGANNNYYGMPFGTDYDQHAMNFSVVRHISKTVDVRLKYGFYAYDEAHTGGINNYTAHLASATCTVRF